MDNRALAQWFHDYTNSRNNNNEDEEEEEEEFDDDEMPSWIEGGDGPDSLDLNWYLKERNTKKHIPKLSAITLRTIVKLVNSMATSEDVDQLDKLKPVIPPDIIQGLISQLSFTALRNFLRLPSLKSYFENFEHPLSIETVIGCIKQEEDFYRYLYHLHPTHPFLKQTEEQLLFKVFDNYDLFIRRTLGFDFPFIEESFEMENDEEEDRTEEISSINNHELFTQRWNELTGGVLQHLNWDNLFVAGGSVLHCLRILEDEEWTKIITPPDDEIPFVSAMDPESYIEYSKDQGFKTIDIDLFIYGLDEKATKLKALQVYDSILKVAPQAHVYMSEFTITIFGPTFRPIQVILCLHKSPAEVLMNFDLNCVAVGYNGKDVLCLPKFILAMKYKVNFLDSSMNTSQKLQSQRLRKYAARGFSTALPLHFRVHGYLDQEVPPNTELAKDLQHPVLYYLCEMLHLAKRRLLMLFAGSDELIHYGDWHWERFWQTGFTVNGLRESGPRRNNMLNTVKPIYLPFKEDQDLTHFTKYTMRNAYLEPPKYKPVPVYLWDFYQAVDILGRKPLDNVFNTNTTDKLQEKLNQMKITVYNDTEHLQPFYMNCCVPTKNYEPDLTKFPNPYVGINTALASVKFEHKWTEIVFENFSDVEEGRISSDPFLLVGYPWQLILESGKGKPLVFVHLKFLPDQTEDGFTNANLAPFCATNFIIAFKGHYDEDSNEIGFEHDVLLDSSMIFTETSDTWSSYLRGSHLTDQIIIENEVTIQIHMQRLSVVTPAVAF